MRNNLVVGASLAALILAGSGGLTGCAGAYGLGGKSGKAQKGITVTKHERLFLRVEPFDAVVLAELTRAGIDPVRMEEEFSAEVRYRLHLRGQEEAQDSAGAAVVVILRVHHLQPGVANSGTYAAFSLSGRRVKNAKKLEAVDWTWQDRAKDNVPGMFAVRHVARRAADDVLARLKAPEKEYEAPPPLHLML